jgi:cellulose synthase/poly-beta-1,6-N-acetylglucosamine synthase-like glycosyltransferase
VAWIVQVTRATIGMSRVPQLRDFPPVADDDCPPISVIFAARDEAEKLPSALATLLVQDYPRYEVIAVNDRSTDGTGSMLREFAAKNDRLKLIELAELPPGWLGKPHALALGAEKAAGEWLLFTDADVHFAPDSLRRAVRLVRDRSLDHLALLTGFEMRGFWEKVTLSYFTVGFILGNEPWLATNPRSKRYVGIGAFQMVRRGVYTAVGGHYALAMEVVEDMKLGKLIKQGGFRSGLGSAAESIWLRWYSGAGNIVRGLTKNMFAAMSFSVGSTLFHLAQMFCSAIVPLLGLAFASGWARVFAGVSVAVMFLFHAGACRRMKISYLYAFTDTLGMLILSYIVVRSTIITLARGGVVWRGTFYPIEELRRGSV